MDPSENPRLPLIPGLGRKGPRVLRIWAPCLLGRTHTTPPTLGMESHNETPNTNGQIAIRITLFGATPPVVFSFLLHLSSP